jgi:branched-chain amino acid transport system permease protein
MSAFANILAGGVFHAAVLFLVAAGLQLVFGVQKIVNLACGSFYALGAYFGITFIGYASQFGVSPWLILPGLIVSGILLGFIGPPIERLLRTVYSRDESFQLLLTFALVLMFQDVFKFIWGANPRSLDNAYLVYGTISAGDFSMPVYNLLVILAAIAIAAGLSAFLQWPRHSASMCAASIRPSLPLVPCWALLPVRLWCRRLRPRSTWRSSLS